MTLTAGQLKTVTDFAREEMRNRKINKHEDSDIHVARCWMEAFERVAKKTNMNIVLVSDTDLIKLSEG